MGRRDENALHDGGHEALSPPPVAVNPRDDALAGDSAGYVDNLAFELGGGVSERRHLAQRQLRELRRVVSAVARLGFRHALGSVFCPD